MGCRPCPLPLFTARRKKSAENPRGGFLRNSVSLRMISIRFFFVSFGNYLLLSL